MTTLAFRAALVAGCAAFGLAGLALAAPQPPAAPDAPKVEKRVFVMRGDGPRHGPGRFHHRDPEKHAQHLRDVLQLTSAQEPALQAFIEGTKPEMKWERREKPDGDTPKAEPRPLTTPERLDKQAEMMAKHRAAFEKRAAAIKAFYAQLTPSQRKAFDALHMDGRGPRGGPRVRVFHHGPGEAPMAFDSDGDVLVGSLDGMDFDLEDFDVELPPMPPLPSRPPLPPKAPGA